MSYSNNINGRNNINRPRNVQMQAYAGQYRTPYQSQRSPKNLSFDYFEKQSDRDIQTDIERRRAQRQRNAQARKKKALRQRLGIGVSLLSLLAGGGIMAAKQNPPELKDTLVLNSPYPYVEETPENSMYPEILDSITTEAPVSTAEIILENNPEVKEQYDKIMQALDTFSAQLGQDALPLIKDRVEKLGNGRVEVIDVLKILFIESTGRIYESDGSGNILKSNSDAYGAFQITKDTQDYLNYYYNLEGTPDELDIMDPYDNLDGCIYNLRFLNAQRSKDLENGVSLPTGDNLKSAVAWGYHDGAWAQYITDFGADYIEKFETLSILDEYPEVVDYIING